MLIALMVCAGFVYAFAFDGFNVETATGGEVEAWLAAAGAGGRSGSQPYACKCKHASTGFCDCKSQTKPNKKECDDNEVRGCQPKCRVSARCKNVGKCKEYVCSKSKFAGNRCTRHPAPKDYCDERNKGKPKGRR